MRTIALAACALALVASAAEAQGGGGGGGGGRQRAAQGNARCGTDLVVVLPDGSKRQYASVEEFLKGYETLMIDQGERERPAVPVDVVLKALGADWMDALNCDNKSQQLPSGLPFEGRDYLIWTGRRGLKAVREVRNGRYNNTLEQIRKLTLHKASAPKQGKP